MATKQAVNIHAHCRVFRINVYLLIFHSCRLVYSTGRTDNHFAFRLIVKIEKDLARERIRIHMVYAIHCRFFIGSNEAFDRAVRNRIVLHNGHNCRYSHTIVCTECRSFCLDPFAVNPSFDRIVQEIVLRVFSLLRHHIHMALHRNDLAILHTRSSGLAHNNIAGFVLESLNIAFFCPIEKELLDFLQVA